MGAVGCMGPASLDHVTRGTTLVSDCGGEDGGASSRVVGLNPRPTNGALPIGTPLSRAVCAPVVTRARAVHWDGIHQLHLLSRDSCSWAGPVFEQALVSAFAAGGLFPCVRLRDRQRRLLRLPPAIVKVLSSMPEGPPAFLGIVPEGHNTPASVAPLPEGIVAVGPGRVAVQCCTQPRDEGATLHI